MAKAPSLVAFDAIQTLFSLEPLRAELAALGLPRDSLELWLARTQRDGFALAATGTFAPFQEVARAALQGILLQFGGAAERADEVLRHMRELPAEPDARPALLALRDMGLPVAIVTDCDAVTTAALLRLGELAGLVETVVTADEVGLWKPRAEVYHHVARLLSLEPADVTLVTAHAWDVHGAREAGLSAVWVRREERIYPSAFTPPDTQADSLVDLVETLLARRGTHA